MLASIRCYFVHKTPTDELVQLIDGEFADRIAAQPGFASYMLLDCKGDLGELVWRLIDTKLAERMAALDGCVAYLVLSGGAGELVASASFAIAPPPRPRTSWRCSS
jgi:hypothetical protein